MFTWILTKTDIMTILCEIVHSSARCEKAQFSIHVLSDACKLSFTSSCKKHVQMINFRDRDCQLLAIRQSCQALHSYVYFPNTTSGYVEQQLFFSDPQRVLCHEVPCWTSSDQYERVRAITPNLTHLLPIHTWDLVTLTSHMTPGRENG